MTRLVSRSRTLVISGALLLVWGSACEKSEAKAEAIGASVTTDTAEAPGGPALPAMSKFQEEQFDLSIVPLGSFKAGQPGQVEIRLVAKSPYKCNDKYPYKFKAKATDGVDHEDPIVRMEKGKLGKTEATLPIRFTPKTPGKKSIEGQFSFSVCTDERCLVERRDLSLSVDVL